MYTNIRTGKVRSTVKTGASYKVDKNNNLIRIDGKIVTKCSCGEGWKICDYCWERDLYLGKPRPEVIP
jgi:hypothetical protein